MFTLRNLGLAAFAGLLGGITSSVFLFSLDWAAEKQRNEPWLLWLLPVAGLIVGGLYDRFAGRAAGGTNLLIEEIHDPRERTPGRTTPLILSTTLISHLFGASVGREGTSVQMGASLADQLSRFFRLSPTDRRVLLQAGSAAGFAGALGAPLAGWVFGMEVLTKGIRFRPIYALECALGAFVAIGVTRLSHAPHTVYGVLPDLPLFSWTLTLAAVAVGLLVGLLVRVFIHLTEALAELSKLLSSRLAVRAFLGAFVVMGLAALFGNRDSLGLGIPSIQSAMVTSSPLPLAFEKLVATATSIASGFRGGEFIPLVFMGATAASAVSGLLAVTPAFAAACGITASFGSAARVPFALSIFAAEHFTPVFLFYALVANGAARLTLGREATIFPSQKRD
ncbi:MAG: chloride channel protein [Bdellovibrionales bacterium]|nr:chloride channel protein [Bdellovibrionales bacterium]